MYTVPKLVKTNDINSAVVVYINTPGNTTIFTKSGDDRKPFISSVSRLTYTVSEVQEMCDACTYKYTAYRVDDPNYIPSIPEDTVLYDVTLESGWVPAIIYRGTRWFNVVSDDVINPDKIVSFRYGQSYNMFHILFGGTVSVSLKGCTAEKKFKNIAEAIHLTNNKA